VTPIRVQLRENLTSCSPEEREQYTRSRFRRKIVVMALGILAMMTAVALVFLR
jgi:hypothetical protein